MPHGVVARTTVNRPDLATLIAAGTTLLPQAIVAAISPWIGRTAERSGRRPLLLFGWGLVLVQGILFATLPGIHALVVGQVLNGFSSAVFGVMMPVVVADLTRRAGRFNLTLGALGMAISIGASLSTSAVSRPRPLAGRQRSSASHWRGCLAFCWSGSACRRPVRPLRESRASVNRFAPAAGSCPQRIHAFRRLLCAPPPAPRTRFLGATAAVRVAHFACEAGDGMSAITVIQSAFRVPKRK